MMNVFILMIILQNVLILRSVLFYHCSTQFPKIQNAKTSTRQMISKMIKNTLNRTFNIQTDVDIWKLFRKLFPGCILKPFKYKWDTPVNL